MFINPHLLNLAIQLSISTPTLNNLHLVPRDLVTSSMIALGCFVVINIASAYRLSFVCWLYVLLLRSTGTIFDYLSELKNL